ncbi:hypothetical protein VFPPC_16234 [Pochonia chlamydosporia 170]|uniref:Uncharacterized protein n=1 Tax=Pochonia chlamydosporia 170 TaxID=1380566 RepID=A0A179FH80_METCM|nr:hypothetical protein VFPPC_16234 [Pochonia chlamydosporia 170]OAQ64611.1 hypothetical protein VFPPC_16234 [Pochonia chlamydosporia 170]
MLCNNVVRPGSEGSGKQLYTLKFPLLLRLISNLTLGPCHQSILVPGVFGSRNKRLTKAKQTPRIEAILEHFRRG